MQLGMIGLGRMGANMVRRLQKNGHNCVVYDHGPATVKQLASEGATPLRFARGTRQETKQAPRRLAHGARRRGRCDAA